jgi:hypothetical protein
MVTFVVTTAVSSPLLWYMGLLGFGEALLLPWAALCAAICYISALGDYVMPAETYRKYRSGEWD